MKAGIVVIGKRHIARTAVIVVCWLACLCVFVCGNEDAVSRVEASFVILSAALLDAVQEADTRRRSIRPKPRRHAPDIVQAPEDER